MKYSNKFDFFQDLIHDLKEEDVISFYNGLNLLSAVKRHLFTISVNSKVLERCFRDLNSGVVDFFYLFFSSEEYDLAKIAFRKCNYYPKMILINLKLWKFYLTYLIRLILNWRTISPQELTPICIYIHHPKFIPLIKLLFSNLAKECTIIVSKNNYRDFNFSNLFSIYSLPNHTRNLLPLKFRYFELSILVEQYTAAMYGNNIKKVFTFEGDAAYNEILATLAERIKYLSFCFQWGAFPWEQLKIGFRDFSHTYYFTWGKYFTDQLLEYNKFSSFIEIGNPLILTKDSLPRKKILFLHQGYDDVQIIKDDYCSFWNFMIEISTLLPDYDIIIRNHPRIPLTIEENEDLLEYGIKHHDPISYSLDESFNGVSIGVTIMSSAIIEATSLGIVPFIYNTRFRKSPFKPNFNELEMGYESDNLNYLKEKLVDLANDFHKLINIKDSNSRKSSLIFHKIGESSVLEFQKFILNADIN